MSLSDPRIDEHSPDGSNPPRLATEGAGGRAPDTPPPPPPRPTPAPVGTPAQPKKALSTASVGRAVPPPAPAPSPQHLNEAKAAAAAAKRSRQPASGIGSARGVSWRDELPEEDDNAQHADEGISVEKEAPAWLVSLVVHLLLMLILALIASPYGRRMTSVVLQMGPENDTGDDLETFELAAQSPEIDDRLEVPEILDPNTDEPVEIPKEIFSAESLIDVVAPIDTGIESVMIPTSGMLSGRSGTSKEALLAAFGGTSATEDAVQLGLKWLAKQQQSDGSWSLRGPYSDGSFGENKLAATAMALLAFQGNGNTHLSGPYQDQVDKGVRWIVRQQDRSGYMAKGLPRHQKSYAQAQASIVLCELYGMTKDSWLRDPAQRAVDFAESAQSRKGGWRYEPKQDADTSVTGWYVMALESAKAADLNVQEAVLHNVTYFLDSVQHYDGAAYGYQAQNAPSAPMTAEGMLCRQYLGWTRASQQMARCVNALVEDNNFEINDQDFYYWYYATQVLHHYGGSPWRIWNNKMREELPAAQVKIGAETGSWAPQRSRWGGQAGRLYTTCMAIYCLEVYYRHMPLYDVELQ